MGFQFGLNLPGSAFDAYLHPPTFGDGLGALGAGIGSALDEAFGKGDYWKSANNKCASGACGHAGHDKGGSSGGSFDVDEFGTISQNDGNDPAPAETPALDATLFRDNNKPSGPWDGVKRRPGEFLDDNGEDNDPSHYDAQGYAPYGRATDPNAALLAEYDKAHPSSGLDAAMASAPRATAAPEPADPYVGMLSQLESSLKPAKGLSPAEAKAVASANRAVLGKIATLKKNQQDWLRNQQQDALHAQERAADDARAEKQLRVSESHLDIARRAENRQGLDDAYKHAKDASDLDDWNQQAAHEGILPVDPEPGYEQPPIFATDKPRVNGKPVIPFTSAKVAESAVKQKWAERTKQEGYEHSDKSREDSQEFRAQEAEKTRAWNAETLAKKQEFRKTLSTGGDAAVKAGKAALAATTQKISDIFNHAMETYSTKDLATNGEYQSLLQHRQALKDAIAEHEAASVGGDPMAALRPPGSAPSATATGPAPKPKGGDYPDATWDDATKVRFDNLPEAEKAKLRKSLTPSR